MIRNLGQRRVQQICKKFNLGFYMAPFFTDVFIDYFLFKKTPVHKRVDLRFYSSGWTLVYFYDNENRLIHDIKRVKSKKFYKIYQYIHEYLNYATEV